MKLNRTLFLPALVVAASAHAADQAGEFAIKDAGAQTCEKFLVSWEQASSDLAQYAGWIAGYVTALNRFTPGVYDATPWQTSETLLGMTRSACGQLPGETRFHDAVERLLRELAPTALREASPLEGVRRGAAGTVAYAAVVTAMKRRLAAEGYDPGPADAPFDQRASDALLAFQSARGLTQTGLPDQKTLFELFMKPGG